MKTRRKTVKTPTKGRRRSSVIVVKKSPIKRNQRRNSKILNRYGITTDYESPLRSLIDNDLLKPPTVTNCPMQTKSKKENQKQVEEMEHDPKPTCSRMAIKSNVISSETIKLQEIVKNNVCKQNDSIHNRMNEDIATDTSKSNKRNTSTMQNQFLSPGKLNLKKWKPKKSLLSRLNESSEVIDLSKSIIVLDNSLTEPIAKLHKIEKKYEMIKNKFSTDLGKSSDYKPPLITHTEKIKDTGLAIDTIKLNQHENCKSTVNSISNSLEPSQSVSSTHDDNSNTVTCNEDIVEIDCIISNETLNEMEMYHDAFNQSKESSQQTCPNFADSVIVIDPDDDDINNTNSNQFPAARINNVPKPMEDCFVVWSSLPTPSTSSSTVTSTMDNETCTFRSNPLYNNNLDILKYDKILIDTNADFNNMRLLNNENNKPRKNQFKSPKNAKGMKKQTLKTKIDKEKLTLKNPKITSKLTNKTTNSFLTRAAAKASKKVETKATAKAVSKTSIKAASITSAKAVVKPTTVRKRGKDNGQLIFSSESKEGSQNKTAKKKFLKGKPREIVIDGSNAAMAYTHNKIFSEKGIKLLIDYFVSRGHSVKVFVPQSRRSYKFPMLEKWHNDGIVVFTPSRKIGNKFITSYDDRYILEYATACGGIVVSQDQFRDLYHEKPEYQDIIENRLLVPTFVGDYVMFPEDPLGRDGPSLADFLHH